VNPTADDLDVELERFQRKLDAGAQFAMTQVLFDMSFLDAFLERLGGTCPIPLLVGVWPLPSLQLARRIHNEVPGMVVPDHVQSALEAAGTKAADVGMALARRLMEEAREKAQGIYVVAPFRRPEAALELFA
jgi:5,10-methylenetetrahydrofolate reductase